MKSKIIIANWKAYLSDQECVDLTKGILKFVKEKKNLPEIVLCPSFISISAVAKLLAKTKKIKIGGQNMCWCDRGAYTGEIPAFQLKEAGCEFVILGHSERRKHAHEKSLDIHERIRAALENGLTPIVCVGETYEEKRLGKRDDVVRRQVIESVGVLNFADKERVIIAYEPVWVIGTGKAVSADEAVHSHQVIKQALVDSYSLAECDFHFQIIYGGSVDPANLGGFLAKDLIGGVLVGGASTKLSSFKGLIEAYLKL
jgi:triosephosphate isomerase